MAHQLESRMAQQMFDTLFPPGEEIVDADDVVTVRQQTLTKVRAEKSRASGHQDGFSINHVVSAGPRPPKRISFLTTIGARKSPSGNCESRAVSPVV